MKEIKFNHNYKKLHNQTKAVLIQTAILKGKNMKKEFIDYDTDDQCEINKKEDYLYLVFVGDKMIPFTTLRKLNKENIEKYVGREGKIFKIVIKEQK